MNMLVAGRDAAASLLCNLFFMLATNLAHGAKVRREVSGLKDSRQRRWS
jgi:cytochrome P450